MSAKQKVCVSNICPSVGKDLLTNFIECSIEEEDEVYVCHVEMGRCTESEAVVTFTRHVDLVGLQKVFNGKQLKGRTMQVEPFHAQETTHDEHEGSEMCSEAVFSGVQLTTDHLTNFLECNVEDCDVKQVLSAASSSTAKVEFECPVAFSRLQQACTLSPGGKLLTVRQADKRGAVLVQCPSPNTKTESFEYYFKNKKRSGGGIGLSLISDEQHDRLIVVFDSKEVALRVAEKTHHLEGHDLNLKLCDLDLDVPPDFICKQLRNAGCEDQTSQDEECHVTSSSSNHPPSSFHGETASGAASSRNITVNTKRERTASLSENGKSDSVVNRKRQMAASLGGKINSERQINEHPGKRDTVVNARQHRQTPAYSSDDRLGSGSLRSHSWVDSEEGARQISTSISNMKLQERRPRSVTKVVEGMNDVYMNVVDAFADPISELFRRVKVTVQDGCVRLEGEDEEVVTKAEKCLTVLLRGQRSSQYLVEVADRFEGWENVFSQMEEEITKGLYCVNVRENLDDEEELCIVSLHGHNTFTFDQFLQRFVSIEKMSVSSGPVLDLLSTTAWEEFTENDIEEKYQKKVVVGSLSSLDKDIWVVGEVSYLQDAVDFVKQFLQNTPDHETIELTSNQRDFLTIFCSKELQRLKQGVGLSSACIRFEGNICMVEGCRAGVRTAVKRLNDILRDILCKRAIFTHPRLMELSQKPRYRDMWDQMIRRVSYENSCIITNLPDPRFSNADDDDNEDWGQWTGTVLESFPLPGATVCHVVEGKASDMKVDAVLLCRAAQSYERATEQQGPLSEPQGRHATGARPKNSESSRGAEREPLSHSQTERGIHVSPSGALPCKALIHVDLSCYFPSRGRGGASFRDCLQHLMTDVFALCDRHHFSSLAVPVIGVDPLFGYRPEAIDVATAALVDCCFRMLGIPGDRETDRRRQPSSVKDLLVCSCRPACLKGMTFALENHLGFDLAQRPPSEQSLQFLSCRPHDDRMKPPRSNSIVVTYGDISKAHADVLVVPLDIDLDLDLSKSKVTRSLVFQGGQSVQSSMERASSGTFTLWPSYGASVERFEELAQTGVLCGGAGALRAREILYVFLPPWGPTAAQMLSKRVKTCLAMASDKGHRTVAMTALGVGALGYPPDLVAHTAVTTVADFLQRGKTMLENVTFVVFPGDKLSFKAFSRERYEWKRHRVSADELEQPSYAAAAGRGNQGRGRGGSGSNPSQNSRQLNPPSLNVHQVGFTVGELRLVVKQGNILYDKCDVVVNSTNDDFDFDRGGVSMAFKKHCGDELLKLCCTEGNKKKMKKKGLVLTDAPGLKHCGKILHVDLARFMDKPQDTVKACLKRIQDSHPDTTSVAFPALGTGKSNQNGPDELADIMATALREIKKPKKLKEVHIVVGDRHIFNRLTTKIGSLTPSVGKKTSKGRAQSNQAGAAGSQSQRATSPPPATHLSKRDSVRLKGYSLDPTRRDTRSMFIFSDTDDRRQAAIDDIASSILTILGPVPVEENRVVRRSEERESGRGEGDKPKGDNQAKQKGSKFNPLSWIS